MWMKELLELKNIDMDRPDFMPYLFHRAAELCTQYCSAGSAPEGFVALYERVIGGIRNAYNKHKRV